MEPKDEVDVQPDNDIDIAPDVDDVGDADADVGDVYDFSSWDYRFESLPEKYDARQLHNAWANRYAQEASERSRLAAIYDSFVAGDEDPRLQEYEQKLKAYEAEKAKWTTESTTFKQRYETTQQELKRLREQYEAQQQKDAESYVDWFRRTYAPIYEDDAKATRLAELIEEGFAPEFGADLLLKHEELVEEVRALAKSGVPHERAVEFAELRMKVNAKSAPPPRAAAELVGGNGSGGGNGRRPASNAERYKGLSLVDAAQQAASAAMKKHKLK